MNISRALLEGSFDPAQLKYCFHHGKTGQQKIAEGATTADLGQQSALTGQAQGTLGQFEGPINQSPFYKALLTSGVEGTSQAYDQARSNMRERAKMSGFGYNQPVTQGADNQLSAAEAKQQGDLPGQAMLETAPLALSAADQTGRMGMGYGQQAQGWNQQAANLNKARGSWFDTLLKVAPLAASIAMPFVAPAGAAGMAAGAGGMTSEF